MLPLTGHRLAYFTGYLISLIGSIAILSILVFIVIPDCGGAAEAGGGAEGCGVTMPVVYVVFLIFAALIVYSGVRLAEIVLEVRGG